MRIPDDYTTWNVASEVKDPESVLNFWRAMIALRKSHEDILVRTPLNRPVLMLIKKVYGSFELLCPENEAIFAYIRANSTLIVLNFSENISHYLLPNHLVPGETIVNTQPGAAKRVDSSIVIQPYSGVVYHLM
jgi:oligo-1,6-glucosidase